jgi:opacity protein-like surface antigen
MRKIALIAVAVALIVEAASATNLAVRVSGGLSFISGGDLKTGLSGENDFLKQSSKDFSGSLEAPASGLNISGELLVQFKRFGLGLGAGYLHLSRESSVQYAWDYFWWAVEEKRTIKPDIRVIPVTLSIYWRVPIGSRLTLSIGGGPGLYLTKLRYNSNLVSSLWGQNPAEYSFQANKTTFGAQGGLDIEIRLSRSLALLVGVHGRLAKVGDIKGDASFRWKSFQQSSQDVYWIYDQAADDKKYKRFSFTAETPSEIGVENARKGNLDLSGVTAVFGFQFGF